MNNPKEIECWFCGRVDKPLRWTIMKRRAKHGTGRYCSKDCAHNDCWGPAFRNATIRYIPGGKKGTPQ